MASIRRMSPLARARPGSPASRRWSLRRQMIRSPADASAPSAMRTARVALDQAEVDQVLADPGGQFPAPGPVRGHQQDVPPGQVAGHVGMDGLVHGLLGRGAADPAVLVVVVQRGGVPVAQPQRGLAFPCGFEPDRLGQLHVPEPVRQQHHRAAAFHGGELLLIPGQHQLAAVARRVFDQRGQVGQGHHRPFVHLDQRARRDGVEVGQEPGGVRRDADTGVAELVGGVLGGRGAEHRAAPRPRGGGQDPGLAGPGRYPRDMTRPHQCLQRSWCSLFRHRC